MTYVINEACIGIKDKTCVEQCPVDCIYEGEHMLYINPTECVDCGACEPVCPVDAIFYEDDLPNDSEKFKAINEAFFDKIGNPGKAEYIGKTDNDPKEVREIAMNLNKEDV